jgi:hypothetical protein
MAVTFPSRRFFITYNRPSGWGSDPARAWQPLAAEVPSAHVIELNGSTPAVVIAENSDMTCSNFGAVSFLKNGTEVRVMGHTDEGTLEGIAESLLARWPVARPVRAAATVEPPAWLAKIVVGVEKRYGDHDAGGGLSIHFGARKIVVATFGEFTLHQLDCTFSSSCNEAHTRHFSFLRLTIDAHTHRILSEQLSHRVGGDQPSRIARDSDHDLSIFSPTPGVIPCSIPQGGAQVRGTAGIPGRCVTEYAAALPSLHGRAIRIRFGERWRDAHRVQRAAWIVTVADRNGHVLSTEVTGEPPQLWK